MNNDLDNHFHLSKEANDIPDIMRNLSRQIKSVTTLTRVGAKSVKANKLTKYQDICHYIYSINDMMIEVSELNNKLNSKIGSIFKYIGNSQSNNAVHY